MRAAFQSSPKICVTLLRSSTGPLHSSIRTSGMVSITVVCVYFIILSTVIDIASRTASATMYSSVQAKDVSPTSFGTFNVRELEEIVYDIEILKVPVPEPGDREDLDAAHEEGEDGVERMEEESKNQESNVETEKPDDAKASHLEVNNARRLQ